MTQSIAALDPGSPPASTLAVGVGRADGPRVFSRVSPFLPYHEISPELRDKIRRVVVQPTLCASGPVQVFPGDETLFSWLLNHPDRVVRMWQRLGARCLEITSGGDGCFGWTDHDGTDLHWQTALNKDRLRIWYAEGSSRPFSWLPTMPFRAVVVLHYGPAADNLHGAFLTQQADLYVQTDSRAATVIARMLGPSAPRLAEQCITQLEIFFSGLAWYLQTHPENAAILLAQWRLQP